MYQIEHHCDYAKMKEWVDDEGERFYCEPHDRWNIKVENGFLVGYTFMDNFDMESFLRIIGVNMDLVDWDEFPNWPQINKELFDED
jgi:hypothetical protein